MKNEKGIKENKNIYYAKNLNFSSLFDGLVCSFLVFSVFFFLFFYRNEIAKILRNEKKNAEWSEEEEEESAMREK